MISGMLVAAIALWNVLESPTDIGIEGSSGPSPPASNKIFKFGIFNDLLFGYAVMNTFNLHSA